jgi:hypothetical protein
MKFIIQHHLLALMDGINYFSCFVRRHLLASLPFGGECLTSARRLSNFYRRRSRCLLVVLFLEHAVLDLFLFCLVIGNRLDLLSLFVSWFCPWGLRAHGSCHSRTPVRHGCSLLLSFCFCTGESCFSRYAVPTVSCTSSTFLSP